MWRVAQGRVFIFADAASKAAFELDLERNITLADRHWKDEVAGSFSTWQALSAVSIACRTTAAAPNWRARSPRHRPSPAEAGPARDLGIAPDPASAPA